MSRSGRTTIQGQYSNELKIVAVDENGNIVGVLKGVDAGGNLHTLKVDSDGQIISVIKGDQGIVAQDASNRLIAIMKGSEAIDVKQKASTGELVSVMQGSQSLDVKQKASTGELVSVIQGDQGLDVAQQALTGELISVIKGDQGIVAQDASNRLIAIMKGSEGIDVKQQASTGELVSVMQGIEGATLRTVAVDSNGNIVGVMKGNDSGTLRTIAVDSTGIMQADVNKAEKIEIYSTVSTTHFTGSIALNAHESENLTGLSVNKCMIREINIQSKQPLKFMLEFYGKDTFDSTDIDVDSFIDNVELDMTSDPTFRVNNANQYKLNVGGLEILYEDADGTKELHMSLHNFSATAKAAGVSGAVQIDIKISPRL